jgi:hypothetical protein
MNELYTTLINKFNFCNFQLNENEISFNIFGGGSKTIQKVLGNNYAIVDWSTYLYCKNENELYSYFETHTNNFKKNQNGCIEYAFMKYAKAFSYTTDVADPNTTIFSNIVVLNHKNNSMLKKLLGKTQYFVVLITGAYVNGRMQYTAGCYEKSNEVLCSTSDTYSLPALLNEVLNLKYNFEFK